MSGTTFLVNNTDKQNVYEVAQAFGGRRVLWRAMRLSRYRHSVHARDGSRRAARATSIAALVCPKPPPQPALSLSWPGVNARSYHCTQDARMAAAYDEYQPLEKSSQQIRLLTIHPAPTHSDEEPVVTCNLDTVELREANPFYALSYVWGPETPTGPISINKKIVLVRRSLWLFLHVLRARFCHATKARSPVDSSIRVWADYVCIQQSNMGERSHQVSMMGEVYRAADAIYAWLGESTTSDHGMQCVAETAAMRERNLPWIQILKQSGDVATKMLGITSSDYWTRMWIKQEALLAKDLWIFYGKDVANWQDVSFVAKLCPKAEMHKLGRHRRTATAGSMLALLESRDSRLVQSEMCTLMQRFADARCQDTRDRIYALLALVDVETRQRVIVDYTKPVFQVLLENYPLWTEQDSIRPSDPKSTAMFGTSIYQLGHFCANMNKILTEADFELLLSSEDVRREVTACGVFAATNASSIDWLCVLATIGPKSLDPISCIHEVETEGAAFVVRISLRPYRSKSTGQSWQCFVYLNAVPAADAVAVWIGSRVLFLLPNEDSAGIHDMSIVALGTEVHECSKNAGDGRLSKQFLLHPSLWLNRQLSDAVFEIKHTAEIIPSRTVPVLCNAAAMVLLLREARGNQKPLARIDENGSLSAGGFVEEEQSMLWSPYGFGIAHEILEPCGTCKTRDSLPKWKEDVSERSACGCRWKSRTEC